MGFEGPNDSLSYEAFCDMIQEHVNVGGRAIPIGSVVTNNDLDKPSKILIEDANYLNTAQIETHISKTIKEHHAEIEKVRVIH